MANSALTVANTDFASIKTNLKSYLTSQGILNDYNFDGSNLAVLIDILAYNTFMQNFYLNQVASESFLDSAQLRDSIISHAKTLNYLPKSDTSSRAVVDFEIFPANTPGTINVAGVNKPAMNRDSIKINAKIVQFTQSGLVSKKERIESNIGR